MYITLMSNERKDISIHLPLDCVLSKFCIPTSKETSKFYITGLLFEESTGAGDPWIPLTKG